MLTVPRAMLGALGLEAGASVGIRIEGDRLVIERVRPHYSLEQLLAEHAEMADAAAADAEWLAGPAAGREEI
jgi:antitoxin ChpS